MTLPALYPLLYQEVVRQALAEDLGRAGDLTSDAVVTADARARSAIRARRPGRVAGLEPALHAFRLLDPPTAATSRPAGCWRGSPAAPARCCRRNAPP